MATSARNRTAPASKATAPKPGPRPGQTPAAPPAPVEKVTASKLDFSALTVVDAPLPAKSSQQSLDQTPIVSWVQASWDARTEVKVMRGTGDQRKEVTVEHGASKAVTIPEDAVTSFDSLLREAGARLGVGIAVRPGETDADGNVKVAFRAQTKSVGQGRPRGSKNKTSN